MLYLAISLYFYWLIGNSLENEWGSFKFDVFYLCGVLCSIVSGFITGFATTEYLNMSLFLAFAILYPDHQVLLFFLLPIKMKWLALIDLIGLLLLAVMSILTGAWPMLVAVLVSFLNIGLFFWRRAYNRIKSRLRRRRWKRRAKRPNDNEYPFDL
jgi:hypothetical protein